MTRSEEKQLEELLSVLLLYQKPGPNDDPTYVMVERRHIQLMMNIVNNVRREAQN